MPRYLWAAPPSGSRAKTILLHSEQGIGDTIQFVRYAKAVAGRGGRRILECQPGLKKLLEGVPEFDAVYGEGEDLPEFDVHAPLLSLPHIFGTTMETIPSDIPYIQGPENSEISEKISSRANHLKVGLVWAGNPGHTNDRNRSIPLASFEPIFDLKGIQFYSLQVGEGRKQIGHFHYQDKIIDLNPDFSATASAIDQLDLVISVDTSIAHLSGAMGRPTWTLLPFVPDWRWLMNRDDTPWYPGMRLFRQPEIGDWESVILKVSESLRRIVS